MIDRDVENGGFVYGVYWVIFIVYILWYGLFWFIYCEIGLKGNKMLWFIFYLYVFLGYLYWDVGWYVYFINGFCCFIVIRGVVW